MPDWEVYSMGDNHGVGETENTGIYQSQTRILKQLMEKQVTSNFYGGELNGGGTAEGRRLTADPS